MIPHLFYYQLAVLGLLWLCVMLHAAWPRARQPSPLCHLRYLEDEALRRRVHTQLNKGEKLHDLRQFLFWLLLDSRVVDVLRVSDPTFVTLSFWKSFFFNGLKNEWRFFDNVGA